MNGLRCDETKRSILRRVFTKFWARSAKGIFPITISNPKPAVITASRSFGVYRIRRL
jgi:hypothetical protein